MFTTDMCKGASTIYYPQTTKPDLHILQKAFTLISSITNGVKY